MLDNISSSNGSSVTQDTNYSVEILASDTILDADIESPGVAGSTIIPEPTTVTLAMLALIAMTFARRRKSS